nr:MAG TPA: 43 kDa tail protein [Caudoviricetes sp.]
MEFKIVRVHNGVKETITKKVGSLSWTDSMDSLGVEFSFTFPYSYWDSQFKNKLQLGDLIIIKSGQKEITRGIITQTPINGDDYRGYDYAFYLNKSEAIFQCKKIGASKAITQLLARYGVPIGEMPKLTTAISKLYKDVAVSEIIKSILSEVHDETGKSYRMEMTRGKFCIRRSGYIKIKPKYVDELGEKVSCTKACSVTGTRSIEDMRNQIIIAGTGDKKAQIKATVKDSKSIKKYGLLSQVETVEKTNQAKAKQKGKNLLKKLNKKTVSFTCEMPGSTIIRAGRKIYFNRPEAGIKGWYKVKSATHNVTEGIYTVSLEMEA